MADAKQNLLKSLVEQNAQMLRLLQTFVASPASGQPAANQSLIGANPIIADINATLLQTQQLLDLNSASLIAKGTAQIAVNEQDGAVDDDDLEDCSRPKVSKEVQEDLDAAARAEANLRKQPLLKLREVASAGDEQLPCNGHISIGNEGPANEDVWFRIKNSDGYTLYVFGPPVCADDISANADWYDDEAVAKLRGQLENSKLPASSDLIKEVSMGKLKARTVLEIKAEDIMTHFSGLATIIDTLTKRPPAELELGKDEHLSVSLAGAFVASTGAALPLRADDVEGSKQVGTVLVCLPSFAMDGDVIVKQPGKGETVFNIREQCEGDCAAWIFVPKGWEYGFKQITGDHRLTLRFEVSAVPSPDDRQTLKPADDSTAAYKALNAFLGTSRQEDVTLAYALAYEYYAKNDTDGDNEDVTNEVIISGNKNTNDTPISLHGFDSDLWRAAMSLDLRPEIVEVVNEYHFDTSASLPDDSSEMFMFQPSAVEGASTESHDDASGKGVDTMSVSTLFESDASDTNDGGSNSPSDTGMDTSIPDLSAEAQAYYEKRVASIDREINVGLETQAEYEKRMSAFDVLSPCSLVVRKTWRKDDTGRFSVRPDCAETNVSGPVHWIRNASATTSTTIWSQPELDFLLSTGCKGKPPRLNCGRPVMLIEIPSYKRPAQRAETLKRKTTHEVFGFERASTSFGKMARMN